MYIYMCAYVCVRRSTSLFFLNYLFIYLFVETEKSIRQCYNSTIRLYRNSSQNHNGFETILSLFFCDST